MPAETGVEPDLASVAEKAVQAYNQVTPSTRFRVLTSKWGIHIVPAQVHDEDGVLVPARSILDTRVTVAAVERGLGEHFRALTDALAAAVGTRVIFSSAGGVSCGRGGCDEFRAQPARFTWGADGVVYRDALIELLDRSATTFAWDFRCQSSVRPEDRQCVVNLTKLSVLVTDPDGGRRMQVLRFDPTPEPLIRNPTAL